MNLYLYAPILAIHLAVAVLVFKFQFILKEAFSVYCQGPHVLFKIAICNFIACGVKAYHKKTIRFPSSYSLRPCYGSVGYGTGWPTIAWWVD